MAKFKKQKSFAMNYKYLDVGCKIGGSFSSVPKKFGYTSSQGLGLDINKNHVDKFIQTGNHGIVGDARNLPFVDNSFELVILSHVLEHMSDEHTGLKTLNECLRVASKTVFVCLPFFDEDNYLYSLGLKTFYSDWHGHKNKVTLSGLKSYLGDRTYEVKMIRKLEDSSAQEIIPISAPMDSMDYDSGLHGEKNIVKFERDIWREFQLIISK